jgi:lysophospholipase L1-like esterase
VTAAPARREWAARLLLLALGTLLALAGLEVFLRVRDPFGQRLRGDELILPRGGRTVMRLSGNPKLDAEVVETRNALGFRGPEPPPDFERHLSVVAVGGSVTECRYLTDGRDWPAVVGRELAPRFERLWVNNAGLDGHSTFGHLELMKQRVVRLRPRVVVFLLGVNDVARGTLKYQDRALTDRPDLSVGHRLLAWAARRSAVVGTALNAWRGKQAHELGLNQPDLDLRKVPQVRTGRLRGDAFVAAHEQEFLPGYRERVNELVRVSRAAGILPVLVTQPALYGPVVDDVTGVDLGYAEVDVKDGVNGRVSWRVLEAYNDVVREVAAAHGVPLVELGRTMPKSSRLFYDWVHFTNEGAEEAGRIVARGLEPELRTRFREFARASP